MASLIDKRKYKLLDLELPPTALASVPAGVDGQLAVVTDPRESRVFVRSGGNLLPIHEEYNTDIITMRVDPVGGTTPPAGTIVHNQAEYTALGYDLKLIQDAVNILPPIWNFGIRINLAGGQHLAKAQALGNAAAAASGNAVLAIDFPASTAKHQVFMTSAGLLSGRGTSIEIIGESDSIIQASTNGTTSGDTLTRTDVGTWTVDEHKGRFVYIDSGSGAGQKYVIESNTATTLTIPGTSFSPAGACTFQIIEPAAELLPSTDGVTKNSNYMVFINGLTRNRVYFRNVKFGNTTMPGSSIFVGGANTMAVTTQFGPMVFCFYCMANLTATSVAYPLYLTAPLYSHISSWKVNGPYGSLCYRTNLYFSSSLLYGSAPSSPNYTQYSGKLNLLDGATLFSTGSTFEATDSTDVVVLYWGSRFAPYALNSKIKGNGFTTGLSLVTKNACYVEGTYGAALKFINCGTAIYVCNHAKVDLSDIPLSGSSGNTNGWKLENGGHVIADNPANIAASTNEIDLDGVIHPYTDVAAGDLLVSAKGSRFLRRT